MAAKKEEAKNVDIEQIQTETLMIPVLGTFPLICNRMSEKARQTLLLGGERMSPASRAARLKHNPYEEFRASPYTLQNNESPTYLAVMASSFKKAMMTAALDLSGPKKAQIGRLLYINADQNLVPVYGTPELFMSITRSSDMNHTPDVRTRAILHKWAAIVTVTYVKPILNPQGVANLMRAAGVTAGIGDWRPEKGSGNYGQFVLVNEEDPEFLSIVRQGGRGAQIEALSNPHPYDEDTQRLLQWFDREAPRKGFEPMPNVLVPVGADTDGLGDDTDGTSDEYEEQ